MSKSSYTLWSPNDTVKDAAEVLGISNLPDEVARVLAMDVEYRIHEVVEQALKFMRHSKHTTLTCRDISAALRVMNIEPLYGYDTGRPVQYHEALVGPGQTLYYVQDDEEVDFDKLINEPIPKVPREPSFTAHWLAIEGVVPAIPQNPHMGELKQLPVQLRGSQVSHGAAHFTKDVDVKPLVKHMISRELQLYFDQIVAVLLDENSGSQRDTALYSLRNDTGLHQLTPYFVQFVQEEISQCLRTNAYVLRTMLDVLDCLLSNPSVFIKPYVHQIVPSILTVLVARELPPSSDTETGNSEYVLRDYAASLLRKICREFGSSYPTLRPRLTRTLLKGFMDVQRSAVSHYGIVMGLAALGPEVVRMVIIGNLGPWWSAVIETGSHGSPELLDAIAKALEPLKLPGQMVSEEKVRQKAGSAADFILEHDLSSALEL